jgi:hypothetical protein
MLVAQAENLEQLQPQPAWRPAQNLATRLLLGGEANK